MKYFIWLFNLFLLLSLSSESLSQLTWERQSSGPVLTTWSGSDTEPNGYQDSFMPSVLYDSTTGVYKMWFVSRSVYGSFSGSPYSISHAISTNGVDWFMYSKNPALIHGEGTEFDRQGVHDPFVIFDGAEYKLYYTGFDGSLYRSGLATSLDGLNWTKSSNNPVLDVGPGSWESIGSNAPKVYMVGSTYHMLYSGFDGSKYKIGLATSSDGELWTKHPSNPVLINGAPGSWDSHSVITNTITEYAGSYYFLFLGQQAPGFESVGLATSTDGTMWVKYSANPVFTGAVGSWDNRVLYGSMIFKDNMFHYWYSGYSSSWQAGYATSPLTPLSIGVESNTPSKFMLCQSYPNPFNPSAVIEFALPKSQHVTLIVFNLLGEQVVRLLDERKGSGYHSVNLNASSLPSGVYYYQLRTEEFVETKKMTLLK